ncbi:hypothetical protein ACW9I9_03735 [Pseudomonas pergaminensis]
MSILEYQCAHHPKIRQGVGVFFVAGADQRFRLLDAHAKGSFTVKMIDLKADTSIFSVDASPDKAQSGAQYNLQPALAAVISPGYACHP